MVARSACTSVVPGTGGRPPGRKLAAEAGNELSRVLSLRMDSLRYSSTRKPSRASLIAGAITESNGSRPSFWCADVSPATDPGTPAARCPVTLRSVGSPLASRYMSRLAAPGAVSR